MISVGDKVVCIDYGYHFIKYGDIFTVLEVSFMDEILINTGIDNYWYTMEAFITLREYRRLKLEKLNKTQNERRSKI